MPYGFHFHLQFKLFIREMIYINCVEKSEKHLFLKLFYLFSDSNKKKSHFPPARAKTFKYPQTDYIMLIFSFFVMRFKRYLKWIIMNTKELPRSG